MKPDPGAPKLDLKTGEISGVEALVRWQHPDLGMVLPAQFIPLAEETGLIIPLGRWVLRTACRQNVAWQRAGVAPVCVAVNLSPRQPETARGKARRSGPAETSTADES